MLLPATDRGDDPAVDLGDLYSSSRRLWSHGRIVRCDGCALVYTNPQDPPEALAQVYSSLRDEVYTAEEKARRAMARRHLKFMGHFVRPPGRLLDAGSSVGYFLDEAKKSGWSAIGVEAARWAVEYARNRLGLATVMQGMFEEVDLPLATFDAITMWDFLEHVHAPTRVVRRALDVLRPGGHLFIMVPNIMSLTARLMGRYWPLLLREHLWYFSPDTLGRLLEASGFRVAECQEAWVSVSPNQILQRLLQSDSALAPHVRQAIKVLPGSAAMIVRLPLGDICVAAVKP